MSYRYYRVKIEDREYVENAVIRKSAVRQAMFEHRRATGRDLRWKQVPYGESRFALFDEHGTRLDSITVEYVGQDHP